MADGRDLVTLLHLTAIPASLGFVRRQVAYLLGKGFDVHLLSSPGEQLEGLGKELHVATHGVPVSRTITPWQDLKTVWALRRFFRRLRPQVVVAHFSKAGLVGMLAARLAGVPVCVYHNHGMALFSSRGLRKWILRFSERVTCRLAHRVLCVSHSVRRQAIADGVCAEAKIKTLLSGSIAGVDALGRFDPARYDEASKAAVRVRYAIPANAPVIGYVGRLLPIKGSAELLTAWQTLRQEFADAHLLLVGDYDPRDRLPDPVVQALRTDPRIHVTGWLPDSAPLYSVMDAFVLPSHHEGFSTVCLEASAMGLPVVSTRVPGNVDAVEDGVTGTLVPARDPPALAVAIRKYLNDPALRAAHGRAGRERVVRDFRPEPIQEALYQEYLCLLREKGLPTADGPGEEVPTGR